MLTWGWTWVKVTGESRAIVMDSRRTGDKHSQLLSSCTGEAKVRGVADRVALWSSTPHSPMHTRWLGAQA